jgi:hypothetical protein
MGFTLFSDDIEVSESHREAIRGEQERPSRGEGPSSRIPAPRRTFENLALQQKISSFAIKPNAEPKAQLDHLMRIIDTYERVRGVPLQDVDIQDAIIGVLSRADTNIYKELINSLTNKETL